jgi:uncharacterized Zn finger protein (UPF0148 family)
VRVPDDFEEEPPLGDRDCPVCRGPLFEKDDGLWCPECELRFSGG